MIGSLHWEGAGGRGSGTAREGEGEREREEVVIKCDQFSQHIFVHTQSKLMVHVYVYAAPLVA